VRNFSLKDSYFVHIPKNAGTSIEEVGLIHGLKWGKDFFDNQLYKAEHQGVSLKLAYWHLCYSNRAYDRDPDKCFCVVRDPYSRIISGFNYLNRKSDQFKRMSLNEFINYALSSYFLNEYLIDNHQRPQSDYIFHNGNQVVDHIIKFENIEEEFEELTGLVLSKKSNASKSSLTADDISDKNIHFINYFYHEDFENFGYTRISRI
jgi:hypothetical protein